MTNQRAIILLSQMYLPNFNDEEKDALTKAIEALTEQEPREWIYCEDDSGQDGYRCSGCGFFEPWYYNYTNHDFIKKYQFCPSCGAKMKERTK